MLRKQKVRIKKNRKVKVLGVATLLTSAFSFSTATAQIMNVKQTAGIEDNYELSNVQKLTFSSGNLTVTQYDDNTEEFALEDLQYVSFTDSDSDSDFSTDAEGINSETQTIKAYPNPVGYELNIEIPEAGTVKIFSLDGKVLITKQVTSGIATIDVGELNSGIYVCLYSNGKETQTIKISKQ